MAIVNPIQDLVCNIGKKGSGQINLTWKPVNGAENYIVGEVTTGDRKKVYGPKYWFNNAIRGRIY